MIEVHYSDAVEEKTSLSDRFGLSLAFYPQTAQTYLEIVGSYFDESIKSDLYGRTLNGKINAAILK